MADEVKGSKTRRMSIAELSKGKPLPSNIYDDDGNCVVKAGQVVDSELLEMLARRLGSYINVGSDDSSDADAPTGCRRGSDVYDELLAKYDNNGKREDRQHARHSWCVPLSVQVKDPGTGATRTLDVTSHDISKGGFSFVTTNFIHVGSRISTTFESLPAKPLVRGIVRSCRHVDGTRHRIGVQFFERQSEEEAEAA